jgi:anaerobic selenocysteine-containing dehydrogenase
VEPRGAAKSELDIWREIAERLGLGSKFRITEIDAIRVALKGKYCGMITLEDLVQHPEGIRTQIPPVPFSDMIFSTKSGKVELYSQELEKNGYDPLPFHEEPKESPLSTPNRFEQYPLIMITGRLRDRLHSQYTTVTTGAAVKSFAHCTSCKKCVTECPDEAITMIQPSALEIDNGQGESSAHLRQELKDVIHKLAVEVSDRRIDVPPDLTSLLIPDWDISKCIGCRECELDVCPYKVITPTLNYDPSRRTSAVRTFLRMHPDTAATWGLADGEMVRVESVRGAVDPVILEYDRNLDPRIVWASDGWWEANGNINQLTDDQHTAYGSTPGFNSVLVRVIHSKS